MRQNTKWKKYKEKCKFLYRKFWAGLSNTKSMHIIDFVFCPVCIMSVCILWILYFSHFIFFTFVSFRLHLVTLHFVVSLFCLCILKLLYFVLAFCGVFVFCYFVFCIIYILSFCISSCLYFGIFAFCNICILFRFHLLLYFVLFVLWNFYTCHGFVVGTP